MKYYQILERTPFSIQNHPSEPYQPIFECQLQEAEFNLKLNQTHYYEHAEKNTNGTIIYPLEIANRIVDYWKQRYPFADYQLQVEYLYFWRVKTRLPERFGAWCNVLVRGKMNSCLVEFADGYKVVTSRNYVRRIK